MARVSAASARAHTRRKNGTGGCCSGCCSAGTWWKLFLLQGTVLLAWFCKALQPPAPAVYGTPFGPPVTAPRIRLRGGRHLAYEEKGVPKEEARYKLVVIHDFGGSRRDLLPISQILLKELGVYMVGFDRAGYGESDPNPARTVKSEAFDIEGLADALNLGAKFYIVATSMGGYSAWACLKYIPHRLSGVAMVSPVANYWWSGIPFSQAMKAFRQQPLRDQVAIGLVHYAPWLTYLWNTQRLFPRASAVDRKLEFLNAMDKKYLFKNQKSLSQSESITKQSVHESLHRDMMNMFGQWEFDPGNLENPFPGNEGNVHIWQGDDDKLVPVSLQHYMHRSLPWINYHEVPGAGHFLVAVEGLYEQVLQDLLVGDE